MFVQDDVIFKCGFVCFLKNNGVYSGLQHALLLLRATVFGCRPCRLFEQTGSEETKVNKEMFWPFGDHGVLKTRSIFLENEFLEQLP